MSAVIIKQGIACSIQDAGRYGYQHVGINPTGSMDTTAAAVSNALINNLLDEAVIEMHFPAPALLFNQSTLLALSGADFGAIVNDIAIPINTPFIIQKGCVLSFTKKVFGERCYLAFHKGIVIEKWLNSYSTNTTAKAGGYKGRFLQKDDELQLNNKTDFSAILQNKDAAVLSWKADIKSLYATNNSINITKGKEFDLLNDASKKIFTSALFNITTQSNSMGYRMHGETLQLKENIELISSAVTKGTIQLLPTGQLIILMANHQTTGGYPRIGHVTSAAFSTVAQMPFHSNIQFNMIELEEAEKEIVQQQQYLQQLQTTCNFRLNEYFAQQNLH